LAAILGVLGRNCRPTCMNGCVELGFSSGPVGARFHDAVIWKGPVDLICLDTKAQYGSLLDQARC
jgi:hypothetical protein